jgi:general secretion pathway protein C
MLSRVSAFVVWAVVAASLAFWGLRLLARSADVPGDALPVSMGHAVRGDLARLFPAPVKETTVAEQPALASRMKLIGVVAPPRENPTAESGIALISLDGKPPRAVRVGQRVDRREDIVVQSIAQTRVVVGPAAGNGQATLTLAGMPAPSVGSLPPAERLIEPPPAVQPGAPNPQFGTPPGTPPDMR